MRSCSAHGAHHDSGDSIKTEATIHEITTKMTATMKLNASADDDADNGERIVNELGDSDERSALNYKLMNGNSSNIIRIHLRRVSRALA